MSAGDERRMLRIERPRDERKATTNGDNAKHARARKTAKLHLSDLRGRRLAPTRFIDNGFECIPFPMAFNHRFGNSERPEPPTPASPLHHYL
jgi:hypothetical protein